MIRKIELEDLEAVFELLDELYENKIEYSIFVQKYKASLIVNGKYRNTGIGKLLIQDATNYAISKDCEALELTSMIENINAHRFYENNGFEKGQYKFKKHLD